MTKACGLLFVLVAAAGCATDPRDIGREPHMTPVGAGLTFYNEQRPLGPTYAAAAGSQMRLDDNRINLFRDLSALTVGDVVTVTIAIDDKATIGNSTDRSRDSKVKSAWSFLYTFLPGLAPPTGVGSQWLGHITDDLSATTGTQGRGSINRSEQIRLAIAAMVTAVLPNGNLVLEGSQEIRVNYELRILNIAGIVRPADISKDNTVAYEKIAEARVSYGGRGRLTEFQQPAWGHQLYDTFMPF